MISVSDIAGLIKHPELTSNYTIADLAEIRNKFPYCSSLHLLYLKSLALTNDIHFEEHLRYAAAHVMDRERMYYFIHSGTEAEAEPEKIKSVQESTEILSTTKVVNNETLLASTDKKTDEITDLDNELESPIEVEKTSSEIKLSNLLEAAPDLIDIAYSEDLTSEKTRTNVNEKKTESIVTPNITSSKPVESLKESAEKISVLSDISKMSFIQWLQYKQSHKLPEDVIHEVTNKPENDSVEPTAKKSNLSRADVDALLNKFIKEEPSMPRPQATFFSPTKTAKQSVEESPDLVTETLAKIYALQKNYSKAIQAYEQLSLVYPEKKTFFASRIEKIREEQNKQ